MRVVKGGNSKAYSLSTKLAGKQPSVDADVSYQDNRGVQHCDQSFNGV